MALDIEGLHQHDGMGLYDRLLSKATDQTLSLKTQVVAPNRAFKEFINGRAVCISPANTNPVFYNFDFPVIDSSAMSTARIFIFSAPGQRAFSSLDQLAGLRVGARTGMPYGRDIGKAGLNLIRTKTIEANIRKLQAGRLDAMIAYDPDAFIAFQSLNMDPLPFFRNRPVANHPDTVLCHDTDRGREIVTHLDRMFREMHRDGEFARILAGEDLKSTH